MKRPALAVTGGLILLVALLVGVNSAFAQARPRDTLVSVQGAAPKCPECTCAGCQATYGAASWWHSLWGGPGARAAQPLSCDPAHRRQLYRDCKLRANGCSPAGCPRAQNCTCPMKVSALTPPAAAATAPVPAPAPSPAPAPLAPHGG